LVVAPLDGLTGGETGSIVVGAAAEGGSQDSGRSDAPQSDAQERDGQGDAAGIDAAPEAGPDGDGATPPAVEWLSAGANHTCAILGGRAYCWGSNSSGELGDGTQTDRPSPVSVPLSGTPTVIAAGSTHTCAIVAGDVWCWGSGASGQLGNGAAQSSLVPVETKLPAGQTTGLSAGGNFTCGIVSGGVYCFGQNLLGQLGDGTLNGNASPAQVVVQGGGPLGGVTQIWAGEDHACATTDGGVYCWGNDPNGALGNSSAGSTSDVAVPVQNLGAGASYATIGGWHTCAIAGGGGVWCWGTGNDGMLGNGLLDNSVDPVQALSLTGGVAAIATGGGATDHDATCAVQNGDVYCWGNDAFGRLGDGRANAQPQPSRVLGLPAPANRVAAGYDHSCAALVDGEIRCWGHGTSGQLGDGTAQDRLSPVAVVGL
jgi:alpha-tubulin suppressor-like RCC1 family protein